MCEVARFSLIRRDNSIPSITGIIKSLTIKSTVRSETLDQIHVSDPVALALCNLEHKIFELQKQLDELKKENVKSEE